MKYSFTVKKDADYFEITSRDLPEFTAIAYKEEDIAKEALDALETTFILYIEDRKPIPLPSEKRDGEVTIDLPIRFDFKINLYNEALQQNVTKAEMARRMNLTQKQVDRIWSLNHSTKLETLEQAFFALSRRISSNISLI